MWFGEVRVPPSVKSVYCVCECVLLVCIVGVLCAVSVSVKCECEVCVWKKKDAIEDSEGQMRLKTPKDRCY